MSERDSAKKDGLSGSWQIKKIVIFGLPNTGKSQVFNNLTGKYTSVANYPLTAVETKRTKCEIHGEPCEVIDAPGLHCLCIHSEEELIVRDMIFKEAPDLVIQCIDANRLEQSLTLTEDLLELGIPMVISLNAIDETARRGVWIDSSGLSRLLGVPVVESIAVDGLGTKALKGAIRKARRGKRSLHYGQIVDDGISAIEFELPEEVRFKRKVAVLLLLDDPFLVDYLSAEYGQEKVAQLRSQVGKISRQFKGDFGRVLNDKCSRWVEDIVEDTTRKQKITPGEFSKAFGWLSRHGVFGIPILLVMVAIVFLLVVDVASVIAGWMDQTLWSPAESGINNPVPAGFWNDLSVGDYGVLSLGLANAFLTILLILMVFFIAFNIL